MAACLRQEHQQTEDQKDRDDIPSGEQAGQAPDGNWDDHSHVSRPAIVESTVTELS